MAYLFKLLLNPVALVWLVLVGFCGWCIYRRRTKLAIGSGGMVVVLYILGASPFSSWLLGKLEHPYIREGWKGLPAADAIVVLGGALGAGKMREPTGFNVGSNFDRFLAGIELVHLGKAPNLVLGGGSAKTGGRINTEAELLEPWLKRQQLNVKILDLGVCANTREEARRVLELKEEYGWKRIILVTSAWHMRRAEAVFRSTGVGIIPVACDFSGSHPGGQSPFFQRYLPVPVGGRLEQFRMYLHEEFGWLYYRSRGWIKPGTL